MIDQVISQIQEQATNISPLGATFKFILDDSPIFIDGTGEENVVSAEGRSQSHDGRDEWKDKDQRRYGSCDEIAVIGRLKSVRFGRAPVPSTSLGT